MVLTICIDLHRVRVACCFGVAKAGCEGGAFACIGSLTDQVGPWIVGRSRCQYLLGGAIGAVIDDQAGQAEALQTGQYRLDSIFVIIDRDEDAWVDHGCTMRRPEANGLSTAYTR